MATDLTVVLEDRPGQLARIGEAVGEAGVNIEGMAAFTGEGGGVIHVLVEDDDAAAGALEAAGMTVADRREALVVDLKNEPGSLGALARDLADADVNIDLAYTTFGGYRVVIVSEDLAAARAALS